MSYRVIIFVALFFYYLVPASTLNCGCMHNSQCLQLLQQVRYCKCTSNFTGRFCNIETKELSQKSLSIDVNEQYSYYHISFNNTILYLLQMYFCPVDYQQTNIFEIYIEFQERDGNIDNSTVNKKIMKFEAGNSQCLAFRTLLSTPQQKYDQTSPRLVVRLRRRPIIHQEGTLTPMEVANKQKMSKISIIIYKFQIYQMESLQIGQFVAITLFSALLILLFSYFLCKRTLLRRYRRYHYHAAQRVQDITHFDIIMPSVLRNQEQRSVNPTQQTADLQEQAKECMICLLEVSGTLTRTTPCKHLFHQDCIDEWGRKSLTCPACRSSLASEFSNMSDN